MAVIQNTESVTTALEDTYPADNNLPNLAHGPIRPCGFGEPGQQVFMKGDIVVQVTEDVCELLLRHDGELQHWVMVRLQGQRKANRVRFQHPARLTGAAAKNSLVRSFRGTRQRRRNYFCLFL